MYCGVDSFGSSSDRSVHVPVLFDEVLEAFHPLADKSLLICDATFGGGGHTRGLLNTLPKANLVGLDQDPDAIVRADEVKREFGERFEFVSTNFEHIGEVDTLEAGVDGVLFDLGVSSFQFDDGARGFSFREDAPLDMRMDTRVGRSAAEFLEDADEAELVEAVRDFGEEKQWRKVVSAIQFARGSGQLERTQSFASLIQETIGTPPRYRKGQRVNKIHPATLTFQGVRIAVNREISVMEKAIPAAFEILKPGGILAVISFHSLEDRFIKRIFRRFAGRPEHRYDSRLQEERPVQAEMINTKAIQPSQEEIQSNPRSRSARLRVLKRL
ncbi:MAG: 16S rRNA (cytosine(1402)-N(4))-methyltransferase RsmH [Opitutales bacterium]